MADIVTDLVADITTKIGTVSAIANKIIYMFEAEDLLSESTKVGLPSVGVVYNSLTGKVGDRKQGQHGLAAILTIDIYILGGQQCVEKISKATGVKTTTTQFLSDIRDAIKNTKPTVGTGANQTVRPQTQRVWQFVLEQPVMLDDDSISYVQRWQTTVLLT